jgi:uncharacterized protein DUF4255
VTNVFAIHSVGQSLVTYLTNTYPAELREHHDCAFTLLSSADLAQDEIEPTKVSLYLYRVTMNEHLRSARRGLDAAHDGTPLSVDLHYLLTVWAGTALEEQIILAWAMRQLQQHPVLDRSSLSPEADWNPGEFIQVIPAELSNEDVMRIWDALQPSYRLSVSYIARVVRIDADAVPAAPPVVATRFEWTDDVDRVAR